MAAGAGFYDANGIYHYGEADNIGLVSDLLNIGMQSASDSITTLSTGILQPWTAYTPTLTNLTLGNGTMSARYIKIGKLVVVAFTLVCGSTTSFSGSGPGISLPVYMKQGSYHAGAASITNGSGVFPFVLNAGDGVKAFLYAINTTSTYASYTGWIGGISTAAGAALQFTMVYEAI